MQHSSNLVFNLTVRVTGSEAKLHHMGLLDLESNPANYDVHIGQNSIRRSDTVAGVHVDAKSRNLPLETINWIHHSSLLRTSANS
jgi:catalase